MWNVLNRLPFACFFSERSKEVSERLMYVHLCLTVGKVFYMISESARGGDLSGV